MEEKNPYIRAHLFVAAIRVLAHRHAAPPSIEGVCDLLSTSLEEGNRLCRKLCGLEAIGVVEKAGEVRLFIKDHLKLEQIAQNTETNSIEAELMKFKKEKEAGRKSLEDIRAQQAERKKKLHEELAQKLKGRLRTSP